MVSKRIWGEFQSETYVFPFAGLPSAATESNNSNDTGGSPTSSTSTSPINSPALNCSAPTTTTLNATSKHNHSSGSRSTSVDYSDVKKNKAIENSIKVSFGGVIGGIG